MSKKLILNVAYVVAFVFVVWFVGELAGFEIALWSTIVLSVVATVVLNLVVSGVRRRS